MYTTPVEKTLQVFIEIFHRIGFWWSDKESHSCEAVRKTFFAIFSALLPVFLATNIFLCKSWNDSIFSAQTFIQTAVIYVKCLYLLFKKQEIIAFLFDSSVVHQIERLDELDLVNGKLKRFTKFIRPYFMAISVTGVSVVVINFPIFSAEKRLPFFITYTWNDSEIAYWLTYLLVSLSMVLLMIGNLFTTLIWYIMLNYSIEYELLGKKFRNLGVDDEKRAEKKEDGKLPPKYYVHNLISLTKAHQNLNKYDIASS